MSYESGKKYQAGKKNTDRILLIRTAAIGHDPDGNPAKVVSGSLPGHTTDR